MDYSTIDLARLKRYRTYTLPRAYKLQKDPGNGCILDPPGYPTYFTRNVYTQHGNNPWRGPQMVITHNGRHHVVKSIKDRNQYSRVKSWDEEHAEFMERLRRLWLPLPIDHPRTQAWISYCCGYFRNCYTDPRCEEPTHAGNVHVGPFSAEGTIEIAPLLGLEVPIELMGLEYYETIYADAQLITIFAILSGQVENLIYRPWNYIRQWYPEYDPHTHGCKPGYAKGDWWERWSHKPSPEECPGKPWARHGQYDHCQFCGRG